MNRKTLLIAGGGIGTFTVALVVILVSISLSGDKDPFVQTNKLFIQGKLVDDVDEFYNIPYAFPGRFERSEFVPEAYLWKLMKDKTTVMEEEHWLYANDNYNVACVQGVSMGNDFNTTEDCLVLTVRAPSERTGKLPIVVWYHGGGLVMGSNSQAGYFPNNKFAKNLNAVVISANYRLGFLGYGMLYGIPPNNGLMDQINVLKWVQEYGGLFGGDISDVTVFGESAGASSVLALLFSSKAKVDETVIFNRVVALSPATGWVAADKVEAIQRASTWITKTECDEKLSDADMLICLKEASADNFTLKFGVDVYPGYGYFDFPNRDDNALFDAVGMLYKDGDVLDMDTPHFTEEVYVSNLREEVALMAPWNSLIEANWNVAAPNINHLMPKLGENVVVTADDLVVTPYAGVDPNRIWNQFVTDMRSTCPANNFATNYKFKRVVSSLSYEGIHRTVLACNSWL
eukprot:sb/3464524/